MSNTFNATMEVKHVAELRQTACTRMMQLSGKTAKAAIVARVKTMMNPRKGTVEVIEQDGLFIASFDGMVVMTVKMEAITHDQARNDRQEAMNQMEHHKPVELIGELLISIAPKGTL
jgi:hypothetical protein